MAARQEPTRGAARRTARSSVVDDIKQFILDEGLAPGDPLPTEAALCAELGVSRPHLREALRTLQSLDIVSIRHGRGMSVGGLSLAPMVEALLFRARLAVDEPLRPVRDVLDLRERLDLSVAEELTGAAAGRTQDRLREIVAAMQERHAAGESFAEQDRAFHAVLLESLDNELFRQVNSAFWQIHTDAVPLLGIPPTKDLSDTVAAHLAIVDALEAGDAAAYRNAVRDHYAPLRRQLTPAS